MPYPNFYNQYQGMPQFPPQTMQTSQYQMPQPIPQNVPQTTTQVEQPPQIGNGIIWVQGEAGARSYWVAPNQSVILVDSEQWALGKYVFYIKSMDNSGMPLPLKILDANERNSIQSTPAAVKSVSNVDMSAYITRDEFEEKIASLTSQKKTNSRNKEDVTNG